MNKQQCTQRERKRYKPLTSLIKAILLLLLAFGINSCKKDLLIPQNIKAKGTNGNKIESISYSQFLDNVELNSTGALKPVLQSAVNNSKSTKVGSVSSTPIYDIETTNVKELIVKDTISYVLALKPQTPRATHFQNITIQTAKGKTIAFLTTYIPTKEWIKEWKAGKHIDTLFRGQTYVNMINLSDVVTTTSKTVGTNISGANPSNSINVGGNTIKLMPGQCETINIYSIIQFPCGSTLTPHYNIADCTYFEVHGTWEPKSDGSDWPPYQSVVYMGQVTTCEPGVPTQPGGGGGGGGGNTTPNPPGGYDPCNGNPPPPVQSGIKKSGGFNLQVIPPNPCEGTNPTPTPQKVTALIDYLGLTGSDKDFILVNQSLGMDLYDILDYYDFDEETVISVNMTISGVKNNVLSTSNAANLYNAVAHHLPNSSNIDVFTFITYMRIKCVLVKAANPSYNEWQIFWAASKDLTHLTLDGIGLIPGVGEIADVTNGVIYTIQGDGVNASLSFASAVPIAGWVASGIKVAKMGAVTWVVKANNIVNFGDRSKLRGIIGLVKGEAKQAHHIIPWGKGSHEVVQRAVSSSNPFHLNNALNGIPLPNAIHYGSHANYDAKIVQKLDDFINQYPNATPDQCNTYLTNLINTVRSTVQNNPNVKINELNF